MKIRDRKPKNRNSGSYERLLGNKNYADLMTKISSCVISQGIELEKTLKNFFVEKNPNCFIETFADFLKLIYSNENKKYIHFLPISIYKHFLDKNDIKKIRQPDFILVNFYTKTIEIIEIKEGYSFDTKKSQSERDNLESIQKELQKLVSTYNIDYFICSFYSESIKEMNVGLKNKFNEENLLTGKMFFSKIGLNYNEFTKYRDLVLKQDQNDNCLYIKEIVNDF